MGWVGRLGASVLLLIAAVMIYVYAFPVFLGETGPQYVVLYLVFAGPVVLYLLSRVWRPSRIR